MNDSEYRNLCTKAMTGEILPDERKKLQTWLSTKPKNRAYYDGIVKAWNLAVPPALPYVPSMDEEWEQLKKSLDLKAIEEKPKAMGAGIRKLFGQINTIFELKYRPAIISFATILIFTIGFLLMRSHFIGPRIQEVTTFKKQKMHITLSDGSRVLLNSESSIRFNENFSKLSRQVTLTGEAFFEVTHDERPFEVITENAITTVLGTKFNVRARNEETRVIVREGRVRLSAMESEDGDVILSEGEMSQVSGHIPPEEPKIIDPDLMLGWIENKLVFVRTPIREIIGELERHYDVVIVSMDPALSDQTVTATFEDVPIEMVLSSLCLTLNLQFTFDDNVYHITQKPEVMKP